VGVARYVTKQSFVNSNYKLVNVQWCVTHAAFKGFTEEGINPGFVTLRQLTSKGRQCIGDNRLNNRSYDVKIR